MGSVLYGSQRHPSGLKRALRATTGVNDTKEQGMSMVRVLVGTRKGAFILTSDAKRARWEVSGPLFGGWEIYHLQGAPADPQRLYAWLCRKVGFWRQNPKIGSWKIHHLRVSTFLVSVICDRARRSARRQGWLDVRPEAPELFEGLLPSHPRQVRENHERLEPERLLHLAQGVARLLRRAHDPGPAGHP